MKSIFSKGDKVRTKEREVKKIEKGKLKEPIILSGIVIANEHFDRFVRVKSGTEEVTTRPEYLELIPKEETMV
jgi:hypothetical protein